MNYLSKVLFLATTAVGFSQIIMAAPPKLMVLPDKTWCIEKGYVTETQRNGKTQVREDYDRALVDSDFKNVQLAIAQIMAERNFPLVDALTQQESDDEDEMFDEAFEGAESGAGVATNSYDELLKRAKPDITLKIGWNLNNAGSLYSCDYRIDAIDSYSNKQVAPIAGQTGEVRRTVPLSVALKQTAKNNMDNFCTTLQNYFDDLQTNGREIRLDIRIVDNGAGINMNSEFNGKELGTIIYDWVSENTVNHQFSERSSGRNMIRFDQVRIPLFSANGQPMDAKRWANGLTAMLKSLGIVSENASTGLGAGRIYIGEK
ncbi:MAG: hypothetical protein K2H63_05490 [Paramuribaculum sp.]|nr:hypothetical protein [Paramuribaculum sp.]